MVASSFHFSPGLPVLKSKDLVHWTILGHVLPKLTFAPEYDLPGPVPTDDTGARMPRDQRTVGQRYAGGVWAPAIRHHDGLFYVYFPTPNEGIFVSTAAKPEGPWSKPVAVIAEAGLEDPCPFWDDDGQAYLIHGKVGAGPLVLHRMAPDGKSVLDAGKVIVEDAKALPVLEGPKLYKRNGWYYIFAPIGGVETGPQAVLRSRDIWGPYEHRVVLAPGKTAWKGPHQGGWVETPSGQGWFVHFNSAGAYGRIVHLQPVSWKDDWPVMGEPIPGAGPDETAGQPVAEHAMPEVGGRFPPVQPQTSDTFAGQARAAMGVEPQSRRPPLEPDPAPRLPAPDLGPGPEPGLGPQHPDPGAAERAFDRHRAPRRRRPGRRPARGPGDVRPGDQLDRRDAADGVSRVTFSSAGVETPVRPAGQGPGPAGRGRRPDRALQLQPRRRQDLRRPGNARPAALQLVEGRPPRPVHLQRPGQPKQGVADFDWVDGQGGGPMIRLARAGRRRPPWPSRPAWPWPSRSTATPWSRATTSSLTAVDPHAPMMVGNGQLGFTADITGLQTFPEQYSPLAPLLTMAQWSWHSFPNPKGYTEADGLTPVDVPGRGRQPYAWMKGGLEKPNPADAWLRENPHHFSLGRIAWTCATPRAARPPSPTCPRPARRWTCGPAP
jgi:hypothetical protein